MSDTKSGVTTVLCATPLRIRKYVQKLGSTKLAEMDLEDDVVDKLCDHIDGIRTAKDIVDAHAVEVLLAIEQDRLRYLESMTPSSLMPQRGVEDEGKLITLDESVNSMRLDEMPDWAQKSLMQFLKSEEVEDLWNAEADKYWDQQIGEVLDVAKRVDEGRT